MTLVQLARLGREMRAAQRKYFQARSSGDLEASKRLEREFDKACLDALNSTASLFGHTEGNRDA